MRDLDRIECEVTQYADAGETVNLMDVGDVTRRAAAITQRVISIFQDPIIVSGTILKTFNSDGPHTHTLTHSHTHTLTHSHTHTH